MPNLSRVTFTTSRRSPSLIGKRPVHRPARPDSPVAAAGLRFAAPARTAACLAAGFAGLEAKASRVRIFGRRPLSTLPVVPHWNRTGAGQPRHLPPGRWDTRAVGVTRSWSGTRPLDRWEDSQPISPEHGVWAAGNVTAAPDAAPEAGRAQPAVRQAGFDPSRCTGRAAKRTPTTARLRTNFSAGPVSGLATAMISERTVKVMTRRIAKRSSRSM